MKIDSIYQIIYCIYILVAGMSVYLGAVTESTALVLLGVMTLLFIVLVSNIRSAKLEIIREIHGGRNEKLNQ